jgi:serine/threonine protein kinase
MKVYELLEDEKFYYVISELIEGGSVMNRMRKLGKPFSDSQALIIVK